MSFGQHLRALRAEAVLSRAELAQRASAPVSTLRGWEDDRGTPGASASCRKAEAPGVAPERLAEGVDDPAREEAEAVEDAHGESGRRAP
jgi:transcriptional regulator with XRE-family HTH domain